MTFKDINFNPSDRDLRIFSILWLAAFGALGGMNWYRGGTWFPYIVGVAVVGGLLGLVAPKAMKPIYVAWMVAAFPIGWTISFVLLAFVFYVVFTLFGLVFRLMGRDVLGRSFDRSVTTYWVPRRQAASTGRYFSQF